MYKFLFATLLFAGFSTLLQAQDIKTDSLKNPDSDINNAPFMPRKKDMRTWHPDSLHSPQKATWRSVIVPGWGQLYNHQWYFVPIIYAGLSSLADGIVFNQRNYKANLTVANYFRYTTRVTSGYPQYKLWTQYKAENLSEQTVFDFVDGYHRDRDLCILGFAGAWCVQAIQAYVQGKFEQCYTMDTNLTMKVSPAILNQGQLYADNYNPGLVPGVKLIFVIR